MAEETEEEVVILQSDEDESEKEGTEEEQFTKFSSDEDEVDPIQDELNRKKLEEEQLAQQKHKKTMRLLIILSSVLVLIVIILFIVLIIKKTSSKNDAPLNTDNIIKKIQKKEQKSTFSPTKIDSMLKRANALYENGKKLEALDIYEDIAQFNESISLYNMGVAKMKERDFQGALDSFKKAIANNDNTTVSAINAAICALKLKNDKLFKYYIDLAHANVPKDSNAPLYSYYISLINFYKGYYYESLSALTHPSSNYYSQQEEYLSSKIYAFLDSPILSLDALLAQNKISDNLTKGLLYARIGEYKIAKQNLLKAVQIPNTHRRASLALALVDLKLSNFATAGRTLKKSFDDNESIATTTYPIKTILKDSLFDLNVAQQELKKDIILDKKTQFDLMFYFAPYKVFNAKQTMNIIRKGGINIFVDEIKSASDYLSESSTIAKINAKMSNTIKLAINGYLLKANKQLQSLIKNYNKHTILHYNLALTYAQIGNYTQAYKHFLSSYRLDTTNYEAGLFAVMCGKLIRKDIARLLSDIKRDIGDDSSLPKVNFYIAIAHLIDNNEPFLTKWLEQDSVRKPLHVILDTISAKIVGNKPKYREFSTILQSLMPDDIMANIIHFYAKYWNGNIKNYAKNIQINFFDKKEFNMNGFYYGSNIVKKQYVKMLQISGLLYHQRMQLKNRIQYENKDVIGLMQALAYVDIYTNDFEESYTLYNSLIDEHKQQDTNTLFLGAVASIGANHPENAIALLELAKLTDTNNLESRYGLGLLYQEIKNFEGASIQYGVMGNNDFKSKYFDFKIVKK